MIGGYVALFALVFIAVAFIAFTVVIGAAHDWDKDSEGLPPGDDDEQW